MICPALLKTRRLTDIDSIGMGIDDFVDTWKIGVGLVDELHASKYGSEGTF